MWPEHLVQKAQGRQPESFRIRRMDVAGANKLYVCRRYRMSPTSLRSLGVPIPIAQRLLAPTAEPGLYIFFGKTGSGKTTTAASFVLERTNSYGGGTWTIESPRELNMQGKVGRGYCYQTEVSNDSLVGSAVRALMRASPNIIFIGEIRTREAVRAAISAGNSGHMVVTTFHAGDLTSGLTRLTNLAGDDEVSAALADAFQFGAHLSLYNADPQSIPRDAFTAPNAKGTGTPPRILSVEPLWKTTQNEAGLRDNIRKGAFHMLSSEIDQQRRQLMNRPLPT